MKTNYHNSSSHLANMNKARAKANIKRPCCHCDKLFTTGNVKKHEAACSANPNNQKVCPVCGCLHHKKGTTCSHGCANTYFRSNINHPNWKEDRYQTTCFHYHKKECIICGEKNIVEVHHYDENHYNNDPRNLVPLCPTHHQYLHSHFKNLIITEVNEWHKHCLQTPASKAGTLPN